MLLSREQVVVVVDWPGDGVGGTGRTCSLYLPLDATSRSRNGEDAAITSRQKEQPLTESRPEICSTLCVLTWFAQSVQAIGRRKFNRLPASALAQCQVIPNTWFDASDRVGILVA